MDFSNYKAIPNRITEAREARKYNYSRLADEIGITRQTLAKYEQGISSPNRAVLERLAKVLGFSERFFFKPISRTFQLSGPVFYRTLKTSEASARSMIRIKCDWLREVYDFLNEYVEMPRVDIPNLDFLINKNDYEDDEIEEIAIRTRQHWKLGNAPISNLVNLLESKGFVIAASYLDCDKTDACSRVIEGIPFIYIDKTLKSACRMRFSLAHELGHVLMHSHITKNELEDKAILNQVEHEANRFASAFLMPSKSFISDIISLSLEYFVSLKRKWKTSIGAMIYRCKDLNLINEEQSLILRKQISTKKWTKEEPLDDEILMERPRLISSAVNLLVENDIITKAEFVEQFGWSLEDIADVCSCNKSFFEDVQASEIQLRII